MTPENAEQLEQLTAYLDGELAPDDRAEIERLLDSDAEARRLLDELRETSELVAGLPRGRAPEDLARQVSARLERQALLGDAPVMAAPVRVGWSWANRLALVAAVVLVCTVAWMGWPQFEDQPTPVMTFVNKDVHLGESAVEKMTMGLGVEGERYVQPATAAKEPRTAGSRGRGVSFESVEKPSSGRGVESETPLFELFGAALTGVAELKDETASESDRLGETASVDRLLAGNMLNVADLQEAALSKWSNRMVVHARRPSEVAQLASFIREDMARNDIPPLATAKATDNIAPEASFYNFSEVDPPKRARAVVGEAIEPATSTPTVVVHVPRKQAEQLIASMQNWALDNSVEASWTFNGQPVSQELVAGEAAPQLVAGDVQRGFRSKMGIPVEDDKDGEETYVDKEEAEADGTAEDRKKQAGLAQPEDAEETSDSPPPKAALVMRGKKGGRSKGADSKPTAPREKMAKRTTAGYGIARGRHEGEASMAGDSAFVTLAIALYYDDDYPATLAPPAKAKRRWMVTTTQATPTAEFVGPPAPASQPTTRESTGG